MDEVYLRPIFPETLYPAEQLGLAGMSRESTKGVDPGFDGDLLPAYSKGPGAVYQCASRCADGLKSDDDDMGASPPQNTQNRRCRGSRRDDPKKPC